MRLKRIVMSVGAIVFVAIGVTLLIAASQTGQGIMVNLNASGIFAIVSTDTYRFNKDLAATYFDNYYAGTYTWSCNGAGCGNYSIPPNVTPPDPNSMELNAGNSGKSDVVGDNACAFLDGSALAGKTYKQKLVFDNGLNGQKSATWTFYFDYVILPKVGMEVNPAFTAWTLVSSTGSGTTAHIDINANIAGESAVNNGSNAKVGLKYSFDLGTTLYPRVVGLAVAVDGNIVAFPAVAINYPVDFEYITNAGSNGNTNLLKNGDARTILNSDSFAGNNDGGAGGLALALAIMDTIGLDLPVGQHTVTLTGTVKGNSAVADITFSVSKTLTVVTPGCGRN